MIEIISLEIISIVSLIFGILNMLLNFAPIGNMFLLFIYTVLLTIAISYLYYKNKLYTIGLIALFLPLFIFKDKSAFWFILYLLVLTLVYIMKGLNKGTYWEFSRRLKASFVFIGAITIVVIVFGLFKDAIMPGIPFIIIHLLSSIILVRSIRHLESGMDMDKLRQVNTKYIFIILAISLIFSIDSIRNVVGMVIGKAYDIVIQGIFAVFYLPILIFSTIIEKIIAFLTRGQMEGTPIEIEAIEIVGEGSNYENLIKSQVLLEVLLSILGLVIFILVIYGVYRILSNIGNRSYGGLKYQEEREYIKTPPKKRPWNREKYPQNLKDQIRYYYRRYLRDLNKKELDIRDSDTSLDINEKSKETYKNTDEIRDIYIKARYDRSDVNLEDLEKIKKMYKEN